VKTVNDVPVSLLYSHIQHAPAGSVPRAPNRKFRRPRAEVSLGRTSGQTPLRLSCVGAPLSKPLKTLAYGTYSLRPSLSCKLVFRIGETFLARQESREFLTRPESLVFTGVVSSLMTASDETRGRMPCACRKPSARLHLGAEAAVFHAWLVLRTDRGL
jgi:hypothetical protein